MQQRSFLSADSHIVEPADFWTTHIAHEFAEQAPRASTDRAGNVNFIVNGRPLGSVGAPSQAGVRFDDPSQVTFEGSWEQVRPGCANPDARQADMDRDGALGEVIFPTLGARLYAAADGPLLSACFAAGNTWLAERFCGDAGDKFKGIALLNPQDITSAVAELERSSKIGLSGVMLPTYPGEDFPYFLDRYDPLWAAAADHNLPICFHVASCCQGPGQRSVFTQNGQEAGSASYSATQDFWVRRSVGNMIFTGVLERFSQLKIAIVEHELLWLPYFLKQLDVTYTELSQTAPYRFKNNKLPSDFFRDQIFTTFQEDKIGLQVLPGMIGTDTLMFGSDYPHAESTWPNSQDFLADLLTEVSDGDQRKFTHDNVAQLFGFKPT